MITSEQHFVLSLLKASMTADSGLCVPETVDCTPEIRKILLKNGVLQTVFPTVKKAAETEQTDLLKRLETELQPQYYVTLKQSVLQDHEGREILDQLGREGLHCIALKGWEMRDLYPDRLMRQMADLDILVRPYDYRRIKTVMEKLGYRSGEESAWKHDDFQKGEVHVEMHKRLTDDSGEIQKWERELWNRAVPVAGNVYQMSPEDSYIFHFVHLHKDFMNGSFGLRRIVDTWLLQRQSLDVDEVKTVLQRFGLRTFHDRMVYLSRAAMGEEPIDENCEILLAHAFAYGIYGSDVSYKAGRIAAMGTDMKSGKRRSAINAVFLPFERMKAQFPVLEKWPILLPWFWIKRILRFLRGDVKSSRERLDYSKIREEEYQEMKRFFEAGGV